MKNSTVRNGKSRSKISSVGVGQPNTKRKTPIVTSIATPATTPAATPTKRTQRKDRLAAGSVVVFMALELPPRELPACKGVQMVPHAAMRSLFLVGSES